MKKGGDIVDKLISSINWKIGKFNVLPMFFGVLLASIDVIMMGVAKMVNEGTLSSSFGVPFAVLVYTLEPLIFMKALNYEGLVIANLTWDLVSDIIVTLQGIFVFGEKLPLLRWVGVGFAAVALGLFAYTDEGLII